MPHHQTPNTAIPTKTHAESPKTHQSVTSQVWPPLAAGALGLGAVVAACWAAALPGALTMAAKAVCLAGTGMWYKRDATGAMRTMGA